MTSPTLLFASGDLRVRRLNDRPLPTGGDYVLYWMQIQRRGEDNAALAYAIERANELGLPCVVYEGLRPDYPFASDRIHTFVLEGARDTAATCTERGLAHAFFLPRTPDEARGVVVRVAERARMVVSDDYPTFIIPAQSAAVASRVACPFVVVDDCAVVPLALLAKPETAARTIRPKVLRALPDWLLPIEDPRPKVRPPTRLDLPFEPLDLTTADIAKRVAACPIDHGVPPVDATVGGTTAALARLAKFTRGPLRTYDADRNDPSRAGTSALSPYLHFGHVSARRIALEVRDAAGDDRAEAFLEQLLVRRALSFNLARTRPDHDRWTSLPVWARATLEAHASDARYATLSPGDLEAARSPDELWNAAMNELRETGVIHGYARMLWGKLPLLWMAKPADAHALAIRLNDKWALDGRDPNGYANVSWCFGLHDRPWPERAIFGTVRTMTSASARRKLDFEDYIARWSPPSDGPLFTR